jgi:hypothetical protein
MSLSIVSKFSIQLLVCTSLVVISQGVELWALDQGNKASSQSLESGTQESDSESVKVDSSDDDQEDASEGVDSHRLLDSNGIGDSRFPGRVKIKPHLISLPKELDLSSIDFAITGDGNLDLYALTPEKLAVLPHADLVRLSRFLAGKKVRVRWWDQKGRTRTGGWHWWNAVHFTKDDLTNPMAAVILNAAAEFSTKVHLNDHVEDSADNIDELKDSELYPLVTLMSVAPEAMIKVLKSNGASLLDTHIIAWTLTMMVKDSVKSGQSLDEISQKASNIVQVYVSHLGRKSSEKVISSLRMLSSKVQALAVEEHLTPTEHGTILGATLSGAVKHALTIKGTDERRTLIVNSVSNLVWAGTTFLGVVPLASPVVAGVQGIISVTDVLGSIVWNFSYPIRDYRSLIDVFEGKLELTALGLLDRCEAEVLERDGTISKTEQKKLDQLRGDTLVMVTAVRAALKASTQ